MIPLGLLNLLHSLIWLLKLPFWRQLSSHFLANLFRLGSKSREPKPSRWPLQFTLKSSIFSAKAGYAISLFFFISFLSAEPITRNSNDFHYLLVSPKTNPPPQYPWKRFSGVQPQITKEHFRCRGDSTHPPRGDLRDCGGYCKHSLPIRDGKEFIYPILIELLNEIQYQTGKRVVITSGHRCPEHNLYVDNSPQNEFSKHQIGAEVSFFVEGLESYPEKIVELLINFYKTHKELSNVAAYTTFKRYEKGDTNVSTLPWYNKEIFIKLFKGAEGRTIENAHKHAYISIQVRHDRERDQGVVYSWPLAHKSYYRY